MKLVFATKNPGKLVEATALLSSFEVIGGDDLPEVEETGETFEDNALLKAESALLATGLPSLADDSGLEVDALDGRPGVLSARYGGPGKTDADRRAILLAELAGVPTAKRTARFVCAVALAAPGKKPRTARGVCEGTLLTEERGTGGFGYDRLFVPAGYDRTFGELPDEIKNQLSHRAAALRIAKSWF